MDMIEEILNLHTLSYRDLQTLAKGTQPRISAKQTKPKLLTALVGALAAKQNVGTAYEYECKPSIEKQIRKVVELVESIVYDPREFLDSSNTFSTSETTQRLLSALEAPENHVPFHAMGLLNRQDDAYRGPKLGGIPNGMAHYPEGYRYFRAQWKSLEPGSTTMYYLFSAYDEMEAFEGVVIELVDPDMSRIPPRDEAGTIYPCHPIKWGEERTELKSFHEMRLNLHVPDYVYLADVSGLLTEVANNVYNTLETLYASHEKRPSDQPKLGGTPVTCQIAENLWKDYDTVNGLQLTEIKGIFPAMLGDTGVLHTLRNNEVVWDCY